MKKKTLILLIVLLAVVVVLAQEKSSIVVRDATVTSGVVIVTVDMGGKSVDLQCTQSMPDCTTLKSGKYLMVQLPKNRGMYDCQNVDVYAADTENIDTAQKLGQYCLIQK